MTVAVIHADNGQGDLAVEVVTAYLNPAHQPGPSRRGVSGARPRSRHDEGPRSALSADTRPLPIVEVLCAYLNPTGQIVRVRSALDNAS